MPNLNVDLHFYLSGFHINRIRSGLFVAQADTFACVGEKALPQK